MLCIIRWYYGRYVPQLRWWIFTSRWNYWVYNILLNQTVLCSYVLFCTVMLCSSKFFFQYSVQISFSLRRHYTCSPSEIKGTSKPGIVLSLSYLIRYLQQASQASKQSRKQHNTWLLGFYLRILTKTHIHFVYQLSW